jgi:uncharacterized BrkB/YihY/UPF0761 family membrane protein
MNKGNKVKRIAALIGVLLILSLFIISLIAGILAKESAHALFLSAVFSTIVIPIMIYGFVEVYKYVHRNDPPKQNKEQKPKDQQ